MIQVIHRAIDIIEFIARDPERPKALGEVAEAVRLNHATCANILKTLVSREFIEQIGAKKGYLLGAKAYALTGHDGYRKDLIEAATEEMHRLTAALNENLLLAVMKGNQRLVLTRTMSEHDLQVRTADQKDVFNTASGRLLLAFMPEVELEKFIHKYGLPAEEVWPEAATVDQFRETLAQIRREELAIQATAGRQVIGLAVPIRKAGKVVAGLSVYLPEYRYMATDKTRLVRDLHQSAAAVSAKLH